MGVVGEENAPSEEANFLDDIGVGWINWDNGLIVGVLSWCNISATFIDALFVELCASGNNELFLLCTKCTISSAVRRKWPSKDTCGIGILHGIIVAVSVILSRWVLGI